MSSDRINYFPSYCLESNLFVRVINDSKHESQFRVKISDSVTLVSHYTNTWGFIVYKLKLSQRTLALTVLMLSAVRLDPYYSLISKFVVICLRSSRAEMDLELNLKTFLRDNQEDQM